MAAICLVGAVSYYGQNAAVLMQLAATSILIAALAYWRHILLVRKKAELRKAVNAYEAMLDKAFGHRS